MDNKTKALLKKRAVEAARPVERIRVEEGIDAIRFAVGSEEYAIPASFVSEVHAYIEPTPVPYTPAYIRGIIYIRGRFVSVVDLKELLGVEATEESGETSLLLLSDGDMEFSVAVDRVLEEHAIPNTALQAVPAGFILARKEFISGVTESGTIMLDGGRFLNDPSLTVYQEVTITFKGKEDAK